MNANTNTNTNLTDTQRRWVESPKREGRKVFQLPGNLFEWTEESCTLSLSSRFVQKRPEIRALVLENLRLLRALSPGESAEIVEISTNPRHDDRRISVLRLV